MPMADGVEDLPALAVPPCSIGNTSQQREVVHCPKPAPARSYDFSKFLNGDPVRVQVPIDVHKIAPIPPRPVPVKVTIPVSADVQRIPSRPVPVKLRVSQPGPVPKPLCFEELTAKLADIKHSG